MTKRIGSAVTAVVATVALVVPSLAACEKDRRCVDATGQPVADSYCENGKYGYSWTDKVRKNKHRSGSRRAHRR
ncbi:hypothetical protein [Actinomadura miaoliensis]|uniref:Lipoprotein n=1 Tax=Actinomadura miaoliensis TaxID=430685 RepID=A0ABP7WIQ8_9ACTN